MTRSVKIYGTASIIFGIPFVIFTLYKYWEFYAARDWQETTAIVTISESFRIKSGSLRLKLQYVYKVNNITYTGSNIAFGEPFKGKKGAWRKRYSKKYPVGETINVYYDRDKPHNSVILKNLFYWGGPVASAFLGLLFMLLGFAIFRSNDGIIEIKFKRRTKHI